MPPPSRSARRRGAATADAAVRSAVGSIDLLAGPPVITTPVRIGWRPSTPFVHTFSAIGARPMEIDVSGLPEGMSVDPSTGVASGRMSDATLTHRLTMRAANSFGSTTAEIELVVGESLALTPPLGWNSWNLFAHDVDADVIIRTADAMVANGMRDLGYGYINIDDFWHDARRAPDGSPRAHPAKFPDGIAPVADHLHALGLKLGIYSDAAEKTCGGCFGGLGYEHIDAQTYAAWGVDLLKYDYCHAPRGEADAVRRYGVMAEELRRSGRSIVFSVCEWGLRRPWNWAARLGASYWRTTPDIFDSFVLPVGGVRAIARKNLTLGNFAGPGHWNDPDMLLVGNRGRGLATGSLPLTFGRLAEVAPRPRIPLRGITDTESHTHMTLWAVMAAPLLAGNDLTAMDPFDRDLLCNPEVIAINQDPLGRQGTWFGPRHRDVWRIAKPLVGGRVAVVAANMSAREHSVRIDVTELGVATPCTVRDVWALRDEAPADTLTATLAPHSSRLWVLSAGPSSVAEDRS